jgi:hypothetical protein
MDGISTPLFFLPCANIFAILLCSIYIYYIIYLTIYNADKNHYMDYFLRGCRPTKAESGDLERLAGAKPRTRGGPRPSRACRDPSRVSAWVTGRTMPRWTYSYHYGGSQLICDLMRIPQMDLRLLPIVLACVPSWRWLWRARRPSRSPGCNPGRDVDLT